MRVKDLFLDIQKGSIVRALAGRDKGGLFVVLDTEGSYACIADGKRRRIQHPKRKKLKHLAPTHTVYNGSLETNPQIRKAIREFNGG